MPLVQQPHGPQRDPLDAQARPDGGPSTRLVPAPGVLVEWIDDEAVAFNPEAAELHYLNAPAALTYALILEVGYEEAMAELRARFELDDISEEELRLLTEDFVAKGLLIDG